MEPKESSEVIAKLAAVQVKDIDLERAREEGRTLRKDFEDCIDRMQVVTPDDLKSRCK